MNSEAELRDYYDRVIDYYSPLRHITPRELAELAGVPLELPLLDLGCGVGWAAEGLPPGAYLGVDYSANRVAEAQRRHPAHRFTVGEVFDFVTNGARLHLAHTADSWGTVLLVEVLEHLEDPARLVAAAREATRQVLGTVPVNMPDPAHLQVYRDEAELRARLAPDKVARFGHHWVVWWEGQ